MVSILFLLAICQNRSVMNSSLEVKARVTTMASKVKPAVLMNRYLREMNRVSAQGTRRHSDLHLKCKDGILRWSCMFLAPLISEDLWNSIAELNNSCQKCKGATTLVLPDFERETAIHFLQLLTQGVARMSSATQLTKLGELLQVLGVDLNKCSSDLINPQQQQQHRQQHSMEEEQQQHRQQQHVMEEQHEQQSYQNTVEKQDAIVIDKENMNSSTSQKNYAVQGWLEMNHKLITKEQSTEPNDASTNSDADNAGGSDRMLETESRGKEEELSSTSSEEGPTTPSPSPVPASSPTKVCYVVLTRLDKGAGCATSDSVKLECKSHACPICGKEYSKRGLLLGHLSRKHYFRELLQKFKGGETDGEGKMVCPLCSKAFRWRPNFAAHMGRFHGKVLQFLPKSSAVRKTTKRKTSMKAKRRRRSVGIHPCTECGEGAFGTGTLARHLCTKHVYQQLKDLVRTRFPGALESLTCHYCDSKLKSSQGLFFHYGGSHGLVLDLVGERSRRALEGMGIRRREERLE